MDLLHIQLSPEFQSLLYKIEQLSNTFFYFSEFMEDCHKNSAMSLSQEGSKLVASILEDVQPNEQQVVQNMDKDDLSKEAMGTSEMDTSGTRHL